jgi:hypothetical protein
MDGETSSQNFTFLSSLDTPDIFLIILPKESLILTPLILPAISPFSTLKIPSLGTVENTAFLLS